MLDLVLLRFLFVLLLSALAFYLQPFYLPPLLAGFSGLVLATLLVLLETRLRRTSLQRLVGATVGLICGGLIAVLISIVIEHAGTNSSTGSFLQLLALAVSLYIGLSVGANGSRMMDVAGLHSMLGHDQAHTSIMILDTSVIIDGRIADIAETGFLNGALAIPQFVLRELQVVADSADSLKRNRGRRGLDILQRIQKMPQIHVQILEQEFPQVREVDMKLVELGKALGARVVTNDFNLNKVAQLHGVQVLNINELANALKPVVLPGEIMRVFVLKEGKEYNQGVAYLDDGTMVVVDNARRHISRTVDIAVTSVLQTTAGKMIFGKFDERIHGVYEKNPAATAVSERVERPHTGTRAPLLPKPEAKRC